MFLPCLSFWMKDIVEAAPSFNLIDEENDDKELARNIVNFLKFCRFFLFYMRRKSPKFYKRPLY